MQVKHAMKFCLAVLCAMVIAPVMAGEYPDRPVKLIVPYAAGGLPDTVARIVAEQLQNDLKQAFVIENKPGGGGAAAVAAIKQSPADGYNLIVTDGPLLAVSPIIIPNLSYDAKRDLEPMAMIGVAPLYLAASADAPFADMQGMIDYARKNPGKINYGSSGIGSIHHLTAEAMKHALQLDIQHVPYKGSSASIPALIGNQVNISFASPPSLMGFAKAGKAKILATNTLKRSNQEPNVPAISEYTKDFDFGFSVVIMGKAGTSTDIRKKISDGIQKALQNPNIYQKLMIAGVEPNVNNVHDAGTYLEQEIKRVTDAAQLAKLQ